MTVGLFFGSFNPVHIGHLIIANHFLNINMVNEVWFIVSPQNPLKTSKELLPESIRKYLIDISIVDEIKLKTSDIEFNLERPSYTINTLNYLKKQHGKYNFKIIMGSDNFLTIDKWKSYEQIVKNYSFLIYQRPGFVIDNKDKTNIPEVSEPSLNISSTFIRESIKKNLSIKYLVPDAVMEEIKRNKYYL